jgi:hypothetical protein
MNIVGHGWDEKDFRERFAPIIEQMTCDRGWIVNCYAQVEFLIADIIVKSRKFPEYQHLIAGPVPFGINRRSEVIRKLCESGPLHAHRDTVLPLVDRLLKLEETRHFFTHGFLSVHIERGGKRLGMHLRRYVPPKKGELETRSELLVFPEQMAEERRRWLVYAQTAVELLRKVYDELGLESHDVTDGEPTVLGLHPAS